MYWDNGKENGNYYNGVISSLGFRALRRSWTAAFLSGGFGNQLQLSQAAWGMFRTRGLHWFISGLRTWGTYKGNLLGDPWLVWHRQGSRVLGRRLCSCGRFGIWSLSRLEKREARGLSGFKTPSRTQNTPLLSGICIIPARRILIFRNIHATYPQIVLRSGRHQALTRRRHGVRSWES